jgi:hypothetical protein
MKTLSKLTFALSFLCLLLSTHPAAAYYDPGLQRWLNRDPIQEADGVNLYNFVRNTPVVAKDPLGKRSILGPVGMCACLALAAKNLHDDINKAEKAHENCLDTCKDSDCVQDCNTTFNITVAEASAQYLTSSLDCLIMFGKSPPKGPPGIRYTRPEVPPWWKL